MKLQLSRHTLEGNPVVEITDQDGRICGTIMTTAEGLQITSNWLAGAIFYEDTHPRQADILFHPEMARLSPGPIRAPIAKNSPREKPLVTH